MTLVVKTRSNTAGLEVEQRALASDSRVEHEGVEGAEVGDRLRHGTVGVGDHPDVGHDREPVDLAGDLVDRPRPATRDGNRVPVCCEPPRNRRADPRPTAGDERDATHARRSFTISWSSTV